MKKLFAFVLDCNHHLICLVNQIRGRGEDRRRSGKKKKKSSKNAKYLDDLDRLKIYGAGRTPDTMNGAIETQTSDVLGAKLLLPMGCVKLDN